VAAGTSPQRKGGMNLRTFVTTLLTRDSTT
jgi:hypothetical protein